MSETDETKGRCRQRLEEAYSGNKNFVPRYAWITVDAIDRLAADVAAIKEKVDAISPEDVAHFVESEKAFVELLAEQRDAAIRECDQARAEAQRIQDEADDQEQTDKVKRLNAEIEKMHHTLMNRTWERDEARAEVERLRAELEQRQPAGNSPEIPDSSPVDPQPAAPAAGWLTDEEREFLQSRSRAIRRWLVGRLPPPIEVTREVDLIDGILSRAGSPPVVVLPTVFARSLLGDELVALQQVKDAMNKAGIPWKEVGRE